jgi:hypothetical protein
LIFTKPGETALDISAEVEACAARLNGAEGKEFLLLPVGEPRLAIPWILASFQSHLAVVPFSAQIPAAAQAKIIAQLPNGFLWCQPLSGVC